MPFRNPTYLDSELLSNLADYYGIGVPTETNVIRRSLKEGAKGAGVNKVVTARLEANHAEETTESYSVSSRPVRVLNDLLDHVTSGGHLIDLDEDADAVLSNGALVQLSGDVQLSTANEVGAIMSRFMPLLLSKVSSGATNFDVPESEIARAFIAEGDISQPQLFELEPDLDLDGRRCLLLVDPAYLLGSSTVDDIEGDQSIVAHVDRLIRPRAEMRLDKYILPGLPRTLRRALGKNALADMVEGLDGVLGRKIDPSELTVVGPALMLRPLALF